MNIIYDYNYFELPRTISISTRVLAALRSDTNAPIKYTTIVINTTAISTLGDTTISK